jgi:hypothetical protein
MNLLSSFTAKTQRTQRKTWLGKILTEAEGDIEANGPINNEKSRPYALSPV